MVSVDEWSYEDFLTYLLILGANADLEFSDDQRESVIAKVGEEEFNKVKRVYEKQNDAQHIDTVSRLYRKYEDRIGGKENLVRKLQEIFTSVDHPVSVMDQELMMMLKKIL